MFQTIKAKFILLSTIVIVLSIGIPVTYLLIQVDKNFNERSELLIETAIDLLIDGLNNSMMKGEEKNIQRIVEQISKSKSIDHVRIFNQLGIIKYANDSTVIGQNIYIIEPGHIEQDVPKISERIISLDKVSNVFKAVQPIIIEERCQVCHGENRIISYLDVDTDFTEAEIKFYTGSFHMVFLGVVLILFLTVGFYFIFNRFINKPLNKFMLALDDVENGNLDRRLPSIGQDEFSILNNHYNRMVKELKYSREKIDEMHFEQLQRADKMITLGELTASIAHDINNHSAIIMSRADYLLYETESNNNLIKYKEDLDVVNNQIDKISKITKNILKHSKKSPENFMRLDLVNVVNDIFDMMEPLIKKRKIFLKRDIQLKEAFINGDPNQLEQMILNLISNASDALLDGGEILIVIQKNYEDNVQLLVRDNGIGIEKGALEKIFLPFYTKKGSDKGTGLGLYIVKNICKNHSAEILCESEINNGTIFEITFNSGEKND